MKSYIKHLLCMTALASLMGFAACQDDFDGHIPEMVVPQAAHKANMTVQEFKDLYWKEGTENRNYADIVGFLPGTENEHIYLAVRVISSDEQGNIFKKLFVQDATGALCFSIDSYNLYLTYRYGQELVVDMTGMVFGAFGGQHVVGIAQWYEQDQVWETGRMPIETFRDHVELNGMPEPEKVDTITIKLSDISSLTPKVIENQLVRINNVYFDGADGKEQLGAFKVSENNRTLKGAEDGEITVNTSGYCSFWNEKLPKNNGDIVALLERKESASGKVTNFLQLNDFQGLMNFGNATVEPGKDWEHPYTIQQVIEIENSGEVTVNGWVSGFIVGVVAPGVEGEITGSQDIEWSPEEGFTLDTDVVLAPEVGITDINQCVIVPLPENTDLRKYANLAQHPENYGKQMWVRGNLLKYMGQAGVQLGGSASDFRIEGVTIEGGGGSSEVTGGDGTANNPYLVSQVMAMNASTAPSGEVYVKGIISKIDEIDTGSYGNATYYISDNGGTDGQMKVYHGYGLNGDKFKTGSEIKVGDVVVVCGKLKEWYSVMQIDSYSKIVSLNNGTGGGGSENPQPETTLGTESSPLTVEQARSFYEAGKLELAWVQGYIIGFVKSGDAATSSVYSATGAVNTNVLIASTPDCADYNKCLCVQLNAIDNREQVNLKTHPENLGKKLKIKGTLGEFRKMPGITSTTTFSIN